MAARRLLFESTEGTAHAGYSLFCYFWCFFWQSPKEKIACSCGKLRSKRFKQSFGCLIRAAAAGFWLAFRILLKKKECTKENKKPLLSMVRLGPIRECSRMICKANGETPPNSSIIWRHHASRAKKAKVFGRCMGRNRKCAWRYRASQCCIFHQPLQWQ